MEIQPHNHTRFRWAVAALAVLLLSAMVFAQVDAHASPVASKALNQERAGKVKRYWTDERMRQAAVARVDAAQIPTPSETLPPVEVGEPTVVPSQGISGRVLRSSLVSDPTTLPFRLHGKVFFQARDFDGVWDDYVCSGTVVNSPSGRVVITAGHCVFENFWSRRFVFVPGYHDGIAPFGEFVAKRLTAPTRWVRNQWNRPTYALSYDVGAVVLKGATPVQSAVGGARGIAFNVGRSRQYTSFGYPAANPFDGESLFTCTSPFGGRDIGTFSPSPGWISCDMTGGSSGGGWIFDNEFLNSVNSYGYGRGSPRMYGPYFGNVIKKLYSSVKNG